MKISYKCDYALKAIFELSLRYTEDRDSVMPIQELAKIGDMPTKFLEQILLTLKKGGFVKSRRGVNGGFLLARPPKEITIGQVVRFVEGPIEPIACVEKDTYKGCKDIGSCIFRGVWKDVTLAISSVIDTLTFEELVLRYKEKGLNINIAYNYAI